MSRDRVDRNDMRGLVVPRAILPPVRRGNLLPGVVKGTFVGENLHAGRRLRETIVLCTRGALGQV